jgi:hypothetical protein
MHMAEGGHGKLIAWIGAAAAVVGAFVALYGILHHPDTSVADYQRQVRATCGRVHDLLTAQHSEIINLNSAGGFSGNPLDLAKVNKGALLRVLRDNLRGAEEEFELLNAKPAPQSLAGLKDQAVAAQRAWSKAYQKDMNTVDKTIVDGMTLSQVGEMSTILGGAGGASTSAGARLNDAMTSLAGDDCRVTA